MRGRKTWGHGVLMSTLESTHGDIRFRRLLEECCGWNRKLWADAVEFAIATLPDDLRGKKVLEIGASDRSTLAPFFAAKGALASCSYYMKPPDFIANARLRDIRARYRLGNIPTFETNIYEVDGRFDLIVMKSVLGGVCRNDDYQQMGMIIHKLVRNNLKEGGAILTVDNGYIAPLQMLRRYRGTGGDSWTYINAGKLAASLSDFVIATKGFGYLNVASASLQFGFNCEFMNTATYYLDWVVTHLFNPAEHAVLSSVIQRKGAGARQGRGPGVHSWKCPAS